MVAALASVALVSAVSTSTQADTYAESGSAELASLPTATDIKIAQFDPAKGTLTSITVTATLDGGIEAMVTNLSSVAKSTKVWFDSQASADGPGGVDLAVHVHDESTTVLNPGVPTSFNLSGTDDGVKTSVEAVDLAAFTGTGTVDYIVTGAVVVEVSGPAKWRTRGVAHATATITVRYDYTPPETTTTSSTTSSSSTTSTSEVSSSSSTPESSVPGSSVPGSSVPGSSVPGSSVPGSSVPGSTHP